MEMSALLAFAGIAAALIVVPGPDWALVLGTGSGRGLVAPVVAGLALGYALITAVVVAGVAPLVAAAPSALLVLTLVGAGYLIYVGVAMLRRPSAHTAVERRAPGAVSTVSALRQGVGVSGLNPKSVLFFLAILPQFARSSAPWPFAVQLAVLGGTWILLAVTFYASLGFAVQRTLARRPTLTDVLERVAGGAMVLGGIALVAEQVLRHTTHG